MFSGKCFGIDTQVLMYDGSIKLIQDVLINDLLMGDDSTPRRVMNTHRDSGELYKIIYDDYEYVVNGDHILCLRNEFDYMEISVNNYLKRRLNYSCYRVPVLFPDSNLDLDPYLIGMWVCGALFLGESITDLSEKVIPVSPEYLLNNGIETELNDGFPIIKNMKLFDEKINKIVDENSRIPFVCSTNGFEFRAKLLAGIIDANGLWKDNNYIIIIYRDDLALIKDLKFLTCSLGLNTKLKPFDDHFLLYIKCDNAQAQHLPCLAVKPKKEGNNRKISKYNLVNFKIESIGVGEYYGVVVNKNSRFLLADCSVVHNSSELIRRYRRYLVGGKRCIMIKYEGDTRYDTRMVVTHDDVKIDAIKARYLYQVDSIVSNYDVICVDEIQFYKDAHIFCDKWCNEGKIVEVCGLNGTYNRTEFPAITKLLPLVDHIQFLTAICKQNGNDAIYSKLLIHSDHIETIGGSDIYAAVDRQNYFDSQNINQCTKQKLKEFLQFYVEEYHINCDMSDFDNYLANHPIEHLPFENYVREYIGTTNCII